MSSAHGAGLMVAPVLIGAGAAEAGASDHALEAVRSGAISRAARAGSAIALHVGAMLAVMGIVAVVVYEHVGVAVLRKAWVEPRRRLGRRVRRRRPPHALHVSRASSRSRSRWIRRRTSGRSRPSSRRPSSALALDADQLAAQLAVARGALAHVGGPSGSLAAEHGLAARGSARGRARAGAAAAPRRRALVLELVEPVERRLRRLQPRDRLVGRPRAARPAARRKRQQQRQRQALADERHEDHDEGHEDDLRRGRRRRAGTDSAAASETAPRMPLQPTTNRSRQPSPVSRARQRTTQASRTAITTRGDRQRR